MKLVRFGCGCVGFPPPDGEELVMVIVPCDGEQQFGLSKKVIGQSNRQATVLSPEEVERIFTEADRLVGLGRKYEDFQRMFKALVHPEPAGGLVTGPDPRD